MYDPSIGRWLEEDPLSFEAGDANLYRYVGNGPTNAVDPTGLDKDWPSPQLPETTVADPNEAPAQAEIVEFFIEDKYHERFDLLGNGRGGVDITGLLNEKITLKVKVSAVNPKTNHLSHTIVVDIRSGWPPDDPNTADAFQGGMRTDEGSRGEGRIELGPGKQDFIVASSSYHLNGKRTHYFEVLVIDWTFLSGGYQKPQRAVLAKLRVRGFVE